MGAAFTAPTQHNNMKLTIIYLLNHYYTKSTAVVNIYFTDSVFFFISLTR